MALSLALPAAPAVSASLAQAQAEQLQAQGAPHVAIHQLDAAVRAGGGAEDLRAEARLLASTGHPSLALERWKRLLALLPEDAEAAGAISDAALQNPLPEPGPKLDPAPESGLGLWVAGGGRPQIAQVNAYNLKAPQAQHVRYLFVRAGGWTLDGSRSKWTLDLAQARMAGELLAGDAHVHLWLDGSVQGAGSVDAATWSRLAAELAQAVASDKRLAGVHLYPHEGGKALYPLCAELRKKLSVPLSLAVPAVQPEAFRYADMVVLRPRRQQGSLDAHKGWVRDLTAAFLRSANDENGKAMVGLSALGGGEGFAAGRQALSEALPLDPTHFLGVSVWGLVADEEGRSNELAPEVWSAMQLPVERP
jgi:hypothetical protein